MAQAEGTQSRSPSTVTPSPLSAEQPADKKTLWMIVIGHVPVHLYGHGFLFLLPYIAASLGLGAVAVGVVETVRRMGAGVAAIGGGIVTDRYQNLRRYFLVSSLILMPVGYVTVTLSSVYGLMIIGLGLGTAMGSFWHPPAISLLSQKYSSKRAYVISLHRSSGTVGDVVAPLIAGALLAVFTWQAMVYGATVMTLLIALTLWIFLAGLGQAKAAAGQTPSRAKEDDTEAPRGFFAQFADTGRLFKNRSLMTLLLISGARGLADRGIMVFFTFYVIHNLGMNSFMAGLHFALIFALAIVTGPLIGRWSDSVGRKPLIVSILAFSALLMVAFTFAGTGPLFTLWAVLLGSIMFSVNSLTQAGAIDQAEGLKLEGSIMGMFWGINSIFGGAAPLILGIALTAYAAPDDYSLIFPYAGVFYFVGMLLALTLPNIGRGSGKKGKRATAGG